MLLSATSVSLTLGLQSWNTAGHLRAKVCDDSTVIEAEFQHDFENHSEKVYEATTSNIRPGSILELRKIELRVTDCFDPFRMTLWITDFEALWQSENIDVGTLVELDSLPLVQEFFTTYFASTTRPTMFQDMQPIGDIQSQAGSPIISSCDSDVENQDPSAVSQLQFATQAPTKLRHKSPSSSPMPKKRANTTAELHSLIQRPNKRQRTSNSPHQSSTPQHDVESPSSGPMGMESTLSQEDGRPRPSSRSSHSIHAHGHQQEVPAPGIYNDKLPSAPSQQIATTAKDTQEPTTRDKAAPAVINVLEHSTATPAVDKDPFATLRQQLVRGRFLPRRLFRIPNDQNNLVNGNKSWQPPLVGQPAPHGCIPPKLLERLVQSSERQNDGSSPKQQSSNTSTQNDDIEAGVKPELNGSAIATTRAKHRNPPDDTNTGASAPVYMDLEDDEDDEEVDSDDWPSSPAASPRKLPPDSSSVSPAPSKSIAGDNLDYKGPVFKDRSREDNAVAGVHVSQMQQVAARDDELQEPTLDGQDKRPDVRPDPQQNENQLSHPLLSQACQQGSQFPVDRSAKGPETSSDDIAQEEPQPVQATASKVQVKRTPFARSIPEAKNANAIKGRVLEFSDTIDLAQSVDFTTQIPATFEKASAGPLTDDHMAGDAVRVDVDSSHGATIQPLPDPDEDGNEVSQQLYSEMEEHSDGHESNVDSHDGMVENTQRAAGREDTPPLSSVKASNDRPTPVERQADVHKSEVVVPTSFSPSQSVRAVMTERGQAARREFFARQGTAPTSPEINVANRSPAQLSSKPSSRRDSSDVQAVKTRTPATSILPDPNSKFPTPARSAIMEDMFTAYRDAYPSYNGKLIHFERICRLIHKLREEGRAPHAFLWDDFIYRHRREYLTHQVEQADAALEIVPYIEYYNEQISMPEFSKGVIKADFIRSLGQVFDTAIASAPSRAASAQPTSGTQQRLPVNQTSKRSSLKRSIAASSSASNVPRVLQALQHDMPSSPPNEAIPEVEPDLPPTQVSLVESWLNQASGHESPVLGNTNDEAKSQDVVILNSDDEIEESITNEEHNSPSPRHRYPASNIPSSAAVGADREVAETKQESKPWWHDRNTVFKEWARAHERLARRKRLESVTSRTDENGSVMPMFKKKIDIGSWRMR